MTTLTKSINPPLIAADGTTPFTPEQILEQLRILRLHVPEFGPLATSESSPLHMAARVPADLVLAAINTVGASPEVKSVIGKTPETLLAEQEDHGRWSAVEAELETLLSGVADANLARRYRLGLTALQTYNITRQLVRQKEHADLLPHVESMRRLNRFGRRRRASAAQPAVQPPAKPPVAPAPAPKQP